MTVMKTVYDPQGNAHVFSSLNANDLIVHHRWTETKPVKTVDAGAVDEMVEAAKAEARKQLLAEQKAQREAEAAETARLALEANEAAKKMAANLAAAEIQQQTGVTKADPKPTAEDIAKAPRAQLIVWASAYDVAADGRTSEAKLREALKAALKLS